MTVSSCNDAMFFTYWEFYFNHKKSWVREVKGFLPTNYNNPEIHAFYASRLEKYAMVVLYYYLGKGLRSEIAFRSRYC